VDGPGPYVGELSCFWTPPRWQLMCSKFPGAHLSGDDWQYGVMIPGLDDEDLLVPGEELLDLPGFWPAYLLWLGH